MMGCVKIKIDMPREEFEKRQLFCSGGGFLKDGKEIFIPATGKLIWFTEAGLRRAAERIKEDEQDENA